MKTNAQKKKKLKSQTCSSPSTIWNIFWPLAQLQPLKYTKNLFLKYMFKINVSKIINWKGPKGLFG